MLTSKGSTPRAMLWSMGVANIVQLWKRYSRKRQAPHREPELPKYDASRKNMTFCHGPAHTPRLHTKPTAAMNPCIAIPVAERSSIFVVFRHRLSEHLCDLLRRGVVEHGRHQLVGR